MTSNPSTLSPGTNRELVPAPAHLPWLLRRVNQRYRTTIRNRLAECGFQELPQPGYWALMVLARGGTEASQLMDEMGVSKQAISKLIEGLVKSGFVIRKPNRADRRRTELQLSAKGRKGARVIEEAARNAEQTFIADLGVEQFEDLVRVLRQLASQEDD